MKTFFCFISILLFSQIVWAYDENKLNMYKMSKICKYCDLSRSNLNDLILQGSNLQNANLEEASLVGSDFSPKKMEKICF